MKLLLIALLALPISAKAQSLKKALIGNWTSVGTVQLKPTSSEKSASCQATFKETQGFWLGAALSCKTGRRLDRIELRFSDPKANGDLQMHIFDDDGDALVSLDGTLKGAAMTLYHPEVLTFGGTEYRPVMRIDANSGLRLSQFGVPTRSNASQYIMSDFIFEKKP